MLKAKENVTRRNCFCIYDPQCTNYYCCKRISLANESAQNKFLLKIVLMANINYVREVLKEHVKQSSKYLPVQNQRYKH